MWLLGTKGADRTKTLPCPDHEASVAPRRDGRTELEVLLECVREGIARAAGVVASPIIRVSICERSFGKPDFII
jgi:hypothetical protein